MIPYFIVAVSSSFIVFFSEVFRRTQTSARFVASSAPKSLGFLKFGAIFLLVCFAGLRSTSVGTDTVSYERLFNSLPLGASTIQVVNSSPQEVGFTLLMLVVKQSGGNFTSLLLICSSITVTAIFWGLARTTKNFTLSIVLYVLLSPYLEQFNGLRQALAVSLIFLASTFLGINKRSVLTFIFITLIATSIHVSSLLAAAFLVIFLNWKVTLSKLFWSIVGVSALAVVVWGFPWIHDLAVSLNSRYSIYLESGREAGFGFFLIIALRLLLVIFAIFLKPSKEDMRFASWSALSIIWMALGTQSVVISRISSYFAIFLIVLLPNVIQVRKSSTSTVFLLVIAATFYFVLYLLNFSDLVPYSIE